jgi:hypothetical protein
MLDEHVSSVHILKARVIKGT